MLHRCPKRHSALAFIGRYLWGDRQAQTGDAVLSEDLSLIGLNRDHVVTPYDRYVLKQESLRGQGCTLRAG